MSEKVTQERETGQEEIGSIPHGENNDILFQVGRRKNGSLYIDIRNVFVNEDGERVFTKKGVRFGMENITDVARMFNDIEAIVKEGE
jgi:hypothetical protein